MGVGEGPVVSTVQRRRGVAIRDGRLLDGPLDERSGGTLKKTRPGVCPAIVGGDRRCGERHVVREEGEGHLDRTDAILVVGVVPHLRDRHGDVGGNVRVREGEVVGAIRIDGGDVEARVVRGRKRLLLDVVDDDLAAGAHGEVLPGEGPFVGVGGVGRGEDVRRGDEIRRGTSVGDSEEGEGHLAGADAVAVGVVVPDLRHRHGDVGGRVVVDDFPHLPVVRGVDVVSGGNVILAHEVLDDVGADVLREILPIDGPVAVGGVGGGDDHAVRAEGERHGVGADAVLVVCVIPNLAGWNDSERAVDGGVDVIHRLTVLGDFKNVGLRAEKRLARLGVAVHARIVDGVLRGEAAVAVGGVKHDDVLA